MRAGFSRQADRTIDLIDGYVLFDYDSGQKKIRKPRPYVFGDTALALSFDGGYTWQIRLEHETAFSYSFEIVDTVTSFDPDFMDIVMLVKEWDDMPGNKRYVDKW